jgi:hypothetical protein
MHRNSSSIREVNQFAFIAHFASDSQSRNNFNAKKPRK